MKRDGKRPKVMHLTSIHPATDVRILEKECRALAQAGYDVALLAVAESPFTKYGVSVQPLRKSPGRIRRILLGGSILKAAIKTEAVIYHIHDPELIPVGVVLRVLGKRVIYDAHEDLPVQVMVKDWISPALRPTASLLAKVALKVCSLAFNRIVAATPAIAAAFPARKTSLVRNFPQTAELFDSRGRPFREREPLVAYVGGLSAARGAREMVDAIRMVTVPGARLVLAGDMPPDLFRQLRARPGWNRTQAVGRQSRDEVRALLSEARAGLVTFHPYAAHTVAMPTKLFEYMSAGLPVIASDFPLWRRIVEGGGCGIVVDPLSPEAISKAMSRLLAFPDEAEEMGKRGRSEVCRKYDWAGEARTLVKTYFDLVPVTPPSAEQVA